MLLKTQLSMFARAVKGIPMPRGCAVCGRRCHGFEIVCSDCQQKLNNLRFVKHYMVEKKSKKRIFILGKYAGVMKQAIGALKYRNQPELALWLGRELGEAFEKSPIYKPNLTLVPIPMNREKELKRGYNQAELIAQGIHDITFGLGGTRLERNALIRVKETQPLYQFGAEDRQKEISGCMKVGQFNHHSTNGVVLVDDVYTTGATCREAIKVLTVAGIPVYGILAIGTTNKAFKVKSI
ncbi:ComF family protein [Laspinema olomoucense]|uniref:ComF family protein n=1 Tax=Laspinema olomoucense TaxID=3231600 RepID=UPI0021BA67E0|nr:ComF family protein [Laspinema sp. D3d]MCT7971158.1 ComF family protein [Laspinema sp. D3d]